MPHQPSHPAAAGPVLAPHRGRPAPPPGGTPGESASAVVRWAAFSVLLVPVVLLVYGTSFGGAAAATLGLAAVTAGCRVLLRQSERAEARSAAALQGSDRAERGARSAAAGRAPHSRAGAPPGGRRRRSARGSDEVRRDLLRTSE
ncbi:hypothetical protein [Streptomyces sp. NPDC050504]|uniref:hypothetical protein n=1 Tax=Streptomyces sp. NPDC050504 TaxID=3365618 RepID=UPI0037A9907E